VKPHERCRAWSPDLEHEICASERREPERFSFNMEKVSERFKLSLQEQTFATKWFGSNLKASSVSAAKMELNNINPFQEFAISFAIAK
jgi:hypothetical protein